MKTRLSDKTIKNEVYFGFPKFYITPAPRKLAEGESQIFDAIAEDGAGNKYSMVVPGSRIDDYCPETPDVFWCVGRAETDKDVVKLEVLSDGRLKVTGVVPYQQYTTIAQREYNGQKLFIYADAK